MQHSRPSKSKLLPNPARRSFSFAHGGSSGRETLGSDPEGKNRLKNRLKNCLRIRLRISLRFPILEKVKKIGSLDMS